MHRATLICGSMAFSHYFHIREARTYMPKHASKFPTHTHTTTICTRTFLYNMREHRQKRIINILHILIIIKKKKKNENIRAFKVRAKY